jgi:flagellar basal-body rod protein FlgF
LTRHAKTNVEGGRVVSLLEVAGAALTSAERRTEIAARNISNAQTPGYKSEITFTEISDRDLYTTPRTGTALNSQPGRLTDTGNPLDIALASDGYLIVRKGDHFFLSRGGQMHRDAQGALVDTVDRIVQQAGGGDLQLDTSSPEVLVDGTVLADGIPAGTIAVVAPLPDLAMRARNGVSESEMLGMAALDNPEIRQGMLEQSNVVLSDEMIGLMRNQRLSEGGAQLIRAYDQLLGQAVTTFGKKS